MRVRQWWRLVTFHNRRDSFRNCVENWGASCAFVSRWRHWMMTSLKKSSKGRSTSRNFEFSKSVKASLSLIRTLKPFYCPFSRYKTIWMILSLPENLIMTQRSTLYSNRKPSKADATNISRLITHRAFNKLESINSNRGKNSWRNHFLPLSRCAMLFTNDVISRGKNEYAKMEA